MRECMAITKALADENRTRIAMFLRGGELCVCQITELFGLAPSTISKHLSILRAARLVDSRKEGRWMYYRLSKAFRTPSTGKMLALLFKEIEKTARISRDRKHLKRICGENMETLCRRIFCKM